MSAARSIVLAASAALAAASPAWTETLFSWSLPEEARKIEDVFALDQWTNGKLTLPQNRLTLERDGERDVISALAASSEDPVSKASLVHEGFDLREGDAVRIEVRLLLEASRNIENVFLVDLECSDCWPRVAPVSNQSPGVRLALKGPSGLLSLDRGKIGLRGDDFTSDESLPLGRWVDLTLELGLSTGDEGWARVYVDGRNVLDAQGATLPSRGRFLLYGVVLVDVRYNYVELGLTANVSGSEKRLFIERVLVERL